MRVLLVSPKFPDTFWSFHHALRFVRKRSAFPPLGLLTVAAMLPREWELRLVDLNIESLHDRDLRWADQVWLGGMTIQRESAAAVIHRCEALGVPTVVGGPMATCEPDHFEQATHLVLGEAEVNLPRFLTDLATGCAQRVYGDMRKPSLLESPAPRWDLAKLQAYGSLCVQFSRGCPYDCDFCNVTALLGKAPRVKSTPQVLAELDAIYATGWRGSVFFVDDNLIGNRKAVRELLPAITKWRAGKQGLPLYTESTINLADDVPLTREMVAAGFNTIFVGIETPSDESLGECHKKQNVGRDLVADVHKLQAAGLQVQGGFILGFDADTPSVFQRQIDFIQRSGIVTAMVGLLQAPIGTRLYQRLAGEGRVHGSISGDNVDGSTNVVTRMPIERLQEGYHRVMQQLYAPHNYYQRVKTFLRMYAPEAHRAPMTWGQLRAFLSSVWHLGIVARGRWQYWKLLAWTAFRRPQHFSLAVRLWIYGYHFREVCRQRLGITQWRGA